MNYLNLIKKVGKKMIARNNIISELKEYFIIEELVCPHALKFGDNAWQFIDT